MTIDDFPANAITAPCKKVDSELFFPSRDASKARIDEAKAVCNAGARGAPCEFRDQCLKHGLHHKVEGIWGGKTDKERAILRERHGIKAEPLSFGPTRTNTESIRRMYRQGRSIAHIADRLDLSYEAVRLTIRAYEERLAERGRPPLPDPTVPVPCDECGAKLLPTSIRKHRKSHCAGRAAS